MANITIESLPTLLDGGAVTELCSMAAKESLLALVTKLLDLELIMIIHLLRVFSRSLAILEYLNKELCFSGLTGI